MMNKCIKQPNHTTLISPTNKSHLKKRQAYFIFSFISRLRCVSIINWMCSRWLTLGWNIHHKHKVPILNATNMTRSCNRIGNGSLANYHFLETQWCCSQTKQNSESNQKWILQFYFIFNIISFNLIS